MKTKKRLAQNLYKTFKKYTQRKNKKKSLLNIDKPLNQLTWEDYGSYPLKAITSQGTLEDFKEHLPRILELYAKDYLNAEHGFYIFLSKLKIGQWESWEDGEQNAIKGYITDWLRTLHPKNKETQFINSIYQDIQEDLIDYEIDLRKKVSRNKSHPARIRTHTH